VSSHPLDPISMAILAMNVRSFVSSGLKLYFLNTLSVVKSNTWIAYGHTCFVVLPVQKEKKIDRECYYIF